MEGYRLRRHLKLELINLLFRPQAVGSDLYLEKKNTPKKMKKKKKKPEKKKKKLKKRKEKQANSPFPEGLWECRGWLLV